MSESRTSDLSPPSFPYHMHHRPTAGSSTMEGDGVMATGTLQEVPVDASSRPTAPPSRQVSNISLPKKKSGIFGTSSNLVNSIVGAGIVGIPYAISQAGFVAGILLLILVAYLTDKSLRLIVETASFHPKLKNLGVLTYEDLMSIPFGRAGNWFVLGSMFVLAYGAMVAYLLIIKDTVPVVLGLVDYDADNDPNTRDNDSGSFVEREVVMIVTSLLIVLPLSMLRDMASLAIFSGVSVLADIILVIIIVWESPVPSTVEAAGGFWQVLGDNWINSRLFIGLGVLSTAMACQHSAFIVSGSLENKTASRWSIVTFRSIFTATALCLVMGVFGYLGFLDETQGDILNNFNDGIVPQAGRALLAITMFFTYPMESLVARHVVVKLMYGGDMDGGTVGADGEPIPEAKLCGLFGRRHKVTFGIYLATLVPALIVRDLGPVLSLTGSIGASCLAYIGPGLMYLGINGEEFLKYTGNKLQGGKLKSSFNGSNANGEIELPVVGDANANIQDERPEESLPPRMKPWWWYVCGYPIWCAIASSGSLGSHTFLSEYEDVGAASDDEGDVIGPRRRDYFISMFFIIFGVLALVAGVGSNIYFIIHDVFFTPT